MYLLKMETRRFWHPAAEKNRLTSFKINHLLKRIAKGNRAGFFQGRIQRRSATFVSEFMGDLIYNDAKQLNEFALIAVILYSNSVYTDAMNCNVASDSACQPCFG